MVLFLEQPLYILYEDQGTRTRSVPPSVVNFIVRDQFKVSAEGGFPILGSPSVQ